MKEPKHVRKYREKHLHEGEEIQAFCDGYIGKLMGKGSDTQRNGVLIVTEKRVVFYRAGILGEVNESIPLKSLTSVERKSTMMHRTIRLHTSHDDLEFKTLNKDGESQVIQAIETYRGGVAESSSEKASAASSSDMSPLEKIKQLGELKDAGVLTEDEFQQKKAELMTQV